MLPKNRPPTHPGEVLLEEFLKPRDLTQVALSERLEVVPEQVLPLVSLTTAGKSGNLQGFGGGEAPRARCGSSSATDAARVSTG
jgi:hypothetical protein